MIGRTISRTVCQDQKNEDRAKEGRIAHKMRPKMLAVAAKVKSFKKGA